MKTNNNNFANVINVANEAMKSSRKERSEFNKEFYSLSKLLRYSQYKEHMKVTAPVFEKIGLATNGKVSPTEILASLTDEQFVTTKKGDRLPVIWSQSQATDKDGNKIFEADGTTPVLVDAYTYIREGGWTMNKLCKLIEQRNSFLANKK